MRIIIGGDICPNEATKAYFESGDIDTLFGTTKELFASADKTIINLECALTESDTPIRKCGPNLGAKPICAKTLKDFGVDICGLSNNHVFDFGLPGLRDTVEALGKYGLEYTGIGETEQEARKPYYFTVTNKRLSLVCVAEHEYSYALPTRAGVWAFDPFETMEDITIAKENADYVIVLYHGGKEQSEYPSPRLRKACKAMVRAGADVILCQHSHCIGVYEEYKGSHILYGQGNFNFVSHTEHPHWNSGLLVELVIDNKIDFRVHPIVVTDNGVTLAEGEIKEDILKAYEERKNILQDEEAWLKEWRAFCDSVKQGYINSVTDIFPEGSDTPKEIFPHYLDCEAHTDVWRELFKTWHGLGINEI
jgi:poly-gamma-glutamate capsule biosynthesis protein CapA/YwtB (metallophosphatase superfamily)